MSGQILKSFKPSPSLIYKSWESFAKRLDFKDIKFPVKIRDISKIEKRKSVDISVLGYDNKQKHPVYLSKQIYDEKPVDLWLKGEAEKNTAFWSKILICSCIVICYIVEEKWCLVRYLNPVNHNLAWIRKVDKDFTKALDFKDIKFAVKIRDIDKIEKKKSVGICVFWLWK